MKFLMLLIAAVAFGQVPIQKPLAPPEPRRRPLIQPRNHLAKVVPSKKFAAPGPGQRGAGIPRAAKKHPRVARKKNGSK